MKNNICGCLKKYCPHFTEAEEDNTICMAKEINKAKLLNNMKPIECINCGLLRSTCEMENGNEWVKNCQKIEGKKHEFIATKGEDDIYCKVCRDCGEVNYDGIKSFLEKHVRGKTDCSYEDSFINYIEEFLKDNK